MPGSFRTTNPSPPGPAITKPRWLYSPLPLHPAWRRSSSFAFGGSTPASLHLALRANRRPWSQAQRRIGTLRIRRSDVNMRHDTANAPWSFPVVTPNLETASPAWRVVSLLIRKDLNE
jgi:hypothetical protein